MKRKEMEASAAMDTASSDTTSGSASSHVPVQQNTSEQVSAESLGGVLLQQGAEGVCD